MGRKAKMQSLRLLLVQASQRGYSPFSNTYCSPLQPGCSYPTHLHTNAHIYHAPLFTWSLIHAQVNLYNHLFFQPLKQTHSRSTQNEYWAHFLHARLLEVVTGPSQLMTAALKVFLFVDHQLRREREKKTELSRDNISKAQCHESWVCTLNALATGCFCLVAGFWWSVAIVNQDGCDELCWEKWHYKYIIC